MDRKVIHEFDEKARHRVIVDGRPGDWASYTQPAVIVMGKTQYVGYTEYFGERVESHTVPKKEELVETRQVCSLCLQPFVVRPMGVPLSKDESIYIRACEHLLNDEVKIAALYMTEGR